MLRIPDLLLAQRSRSEAIGDWLDQLPGVAAGLLEEWSLLPDGDPRCGEQSLVLPVRAPGGAPAALKIGFPDEASETEHLALQHWGGQGAVRLLRADPRRRALLLERLHPEDLSDLWDVEACEVVGGLYARLHRPALPQLRTLAAYVEAGLAGLADLPRDAGVPRRLVEQATSLGRDLLADPGDSRLLHGDLHYANVLAADREPWLVIDPAPLAGDPHAEPWPMLVNRWREVLGSHSARDRVRLRFHTLIDVAELDEDRARDWAVVRGVLHAYDVVAPARESGRTLDEAERESVTVALTVLKAVQD